MTEVVKSLQSGDGSGISGIIKPKIKELGLKLPNLSRDQRRKVARFVLAALTCVTTIPLFQQLVNNASASSDTGGSSRDSIQLFQAASGTPTRTRTPIRTLTRQPTTIGPTASPSTDEVIELDFCPKPANMQVGDDSLTVDKTHRIGSPINEDGKLITVAAVEIGNGYVGGRWMVKGNSFCVFIPADDETLKQFGGTPGKPLFIRGTLRGDKLLYISQEPLEERKTPSGLEFFWIDGWSGSSDRFPMLVYNIRAGKVYVEIHNPDGAKYGGANPTMLPVIFQGVTIQTPPSKGTPTTVTPATGKIATVSPTPRPGFSITPVASRSGTPGTPIVISGDDIAKLFAPKSLEDIGHTAAAGGVFLLAALAVTIGAGFFMSRDNDAHSIRRPAPFVEPPVENAPQQELTQGDFLKRSLATWTSWGGSVTAIRRRISEEIISIFENGGFGDPNTPEAVKRAAQVANKTFEEIGATGGKSGIVEAIEEQLSYLGGKVERVEDRVTKAEGNIGGLEKDARRTTHALSKHLRKGH